MLINEQGMGRNVLDGKIEQWLADKWQCSIDFEIGDALDKLVMLQLVTENDGLIKAVPIQQGMKNLDKRWDDYFLP